MTINPTPEEATALLLCKGGYLTVDGTPEADLFDAMEEKGWVKTAGNAPGGWSWKLSGDGLRWAYRDEP